MENPNRFMKGLGSAVSAIFRILKFMVFGVLLAASVLFVWNKFSDNDIEVMNSGRDYVEAPAPADFSTFNELDLNESTAAPNIDADERRERLLRSIVVITAGNSTGSGVILDNKGCYVVTNEHVINSEGDITAHAITRFRANGEEVTREISATIVGRPSEADDLAILKLEECANLPWAPMGDSNLLRRGDSVLAIGHPEGLVWSMTNGIVSHPARHWNGFTANSGFPLIQTDTAINPGNSGGGLFTPNGELIGINSLRDPYAQNLGFARSSALVVTYMQHLATEGRVYERQLGIVVAERDAGFPGLKIEEVNNGGVASHVGLQEGDILLAVNGTDVDGVSSLKRGMYADTDGSVSFEVHRGTERLILTIDFD